MTFDDAPEPARPLRGDEPLVGIENATVRDFWSFALSDLRMNNARGYLAEFAVAKALGIEHPLRIEWANHDVEFEGISIEVKSAAHLQAWEQRRPSKVVFSGLKTSLWDEATGRRSSSPSFHADVYVLCAQLASNHTEFAPLDVSGWEVNVLSRADLEEEGRASLSLSTARRLAGAPTSWVDLRSVVREKRRR